MKLRHSDELLVIVLMKTPFDSKGKYNQQLSCCWGLKWENKGERVYKGLVECEQVSIKYTSLIEYSSLY